MRFGVARGLVGLSMAAALGGCGLMAPSQQQEFAVTGGVPTAAPGTFLSNDAGLTAEVAKQVCANGYEQIGTSAMPTDQGDMAAMKLRCTPYEPFLSIPYVTTHLY